jgi:L-arabinokinase
MGGIADYTGSLVCEATLDRAAAVALQRRRDRQVRLFSLNLLDDAQPWRATVPLDVLAASSAGDLGRQLEAEGHRWAGYLVGCLSVLHASGHVDLRRGDIGGFDLALFSTVPLGGGVSSSAAIEVASMMGLVDDLGLRAKLDPLHLASLCQQVENRVVGAPCGIMDQVTSIAGRAGALLKLLCQPHDLQGALALPAGVRVLGIDTRVKHSVGGGMYGRTRCAAFMGHKIILSKMSHVGRQAGQALQGDPMRGYLANLDVDDYKGLFRPRLPTSMRGADFLAAYGPTIDQATGVDPAMDYHVQAATDHHVFEARRVRQFVEFIGEAARHPHGTRPQGQALDKAGHLMYASHLSYSNCAMLGAPECDLLVDLVRRHEPAGLYGAKITGGGSGGTVAILADISPKADEAVARIMQRYQEQTGHVPKAFMGSSDGAWEVGTAVIEL